MQFSEHWLRSFVDPPMSSEALAEALTMAGLEVEARTPAAPPFSGIVVGKVLSVERHPNADRLTVCTVDVGDGTPRTIVCGAPNVAAGVTAPCALVGAQLPGGVEIRDATMRGVASQGMLCSARELGLSDDASGLLLLDASLPPGTDLRTALDLDDTLITLKLTPNRADCLSVVGVAREVGAIASLPLLPHTPVSLEERSTAKRNVRIEDAVACPRFCGRVIEGIDARAPSPPWMRQRLERSGIRPISIVVDITNYVMLELGQPLHAYDDDRLQGDIVVRFAGEGEKLTLLNGQVLDLDPSLLLVADEARPLGLAGIMGGEYSGIADSTTRVFLEGAFWNPAVIQGKARRLGFATDAGYRFERGVDFAAASAAVDRAAALMRELAGGQAGPLVDIVGVLPSREPIRVRMARISRILGVSIPSAEVESIFTRLGLAPRRDGEDFVVTPPSYRFDLGIEADLIEEVARLHGYDNIPVAAASQPTHMLPAPEAIRSLATLRARLVDRDFQEVISFSFVNSQSLRALDANTKPVALLNPIASQLDAMRTTLLAGLLEIARSNAQRKAERVRIFEVGRCFLHDGQGYAQPRRLAALAYGPVEPVQWDAGKRAVDFFDLKSDLEVLASPRKLTTRAGRHPALHPGRSAEVVLGDEPIGWIGEAHPAVARAFDLPQAPVVFEVDLDPLEIQPVPRGQPVSRAPIVRRDIAVIVADQIPAQAVLDALTAVKPATVQAIELFDQYRGAGVPQGRKSLAILVLIQDTARTLTDAEIDAAVGILLRELERRFDATLRK